MKSPPNLWLQVFRMSVFSLLFTASWQFRRLDFSKSTDPYVVTMQSFHDKFFTGWNAVFQMVYFLLSVSMFLDQHYFKATSQKIQDRLETIQGYFFTVFVCPSTIFVMSMFWILFLYDRDLIYPEKAEEIIPTWLNQSMHSFIIFPVILELFSTNHRRPSHKAAFISISCLIVIYSFVLIRTYFTTGLWIYPIFYSLTWMQRIAFISIYSTGLLILYFVGYALQIIIWGKEMNYNIPQFEAFNDEEKKVS